VRRRRESRRRIRPWHVSLLRAFDRRTEKRRVDAIPFRDPVTFAAASQDIVQKSVSQSFGHSRRKRIGEDDDAELSGWHEADQRPRALAERAGMTPDSAEAAMLDVPAETVERWRAVQWMVAAIDQGHMSLPDCVLFDQLFAVVPAASELQPHP